MKCCKFMFFTECNSIEKYNKAPMYTEDAFHHIHIIYAISRVLMLIMITSRVIAIDIFEKEIQKQES